MQAQPVSRALGRVPGALRHRNYRLFFTGQVISLIGTWMQNIAQAWLVYRLTRSGFELGLVMAAQYTPMLVAGPFGGIVADRFPKRRVLLATQSCLMLPALALFLLTQLNVVSFWMVLVAAVAVGCVNVVDMPTRQAFIVEMVGREDLMSAIALNSSVFNTAAIVGPSLAGVVIAIIGVSLCFLVNAISFLAAIAALSAMRNLPPARAPAAEQRLFDRIREGAAYARHEPVVGMMLIAVAVVSLFAMNRLTLLPLFAEEVLHTGAAGFGFLMAFEGAGAVAAGVTLAVVRRRPISGQQQFWLAIGWVAALLAFSFSRSFALSALLLFASGCCRIYFVTTANNRIQRHTPDELRGRVMALYGQAFIGVGPLGNAQAGGLASLFGAPVAMAVGAVAAGAVIVGIRLAQPAVFTSDAD